MIISLLILFLRFLVLGQIFFFILQVEIIQISGNFLALLRFQHQEIDRRTTSGCKDQQHRQDRPGIAFLFRFRRFRLGGLRSFLFRTNTFTKVLYADRASGIDRTGLALLRTGADNRCFRLLSILRECHEVGFIHLVQKMHGFLALVVTVDNEIEHIAVLRFHRDKLLAAGGWAADIVDQ